MNIDEFQKIIDKTVEDFCEIKSSEPNVTNMVIASVTLFNLCVELAIASNLRDEDSLDILKGQMFGSLNKCFDEVVKKYKKGEK